MERALGFEPSLTDGILSWRYCRSHQASAGTTRLASTHEIGLAGRGIEPLHPGYEPDQSTVTVPRDKKMVASDGFTPPSP